MIRRPLLTMMMALLLAAAAAFAVARLRIDTSLTSLFDARDPAEYAAGHIPGAINVPADEAISDPDKLSAVDSGGRPIICYFGGGTCEVSIHLAEALVYQAGKKRVLVFMGGWPDWEGAGYPVEK